MPSILRTLLSPEAGEGNGPTDKDKDKDKAPSPDPREGFERMAAKYKDDLRGLAETLYRDNYEARERARKLEERLPRDGSVVLSPEEAKLWSAYRDAGKPDDLKRIVREHQELSRAVKAQERREEVRKVAGLAGVAPTVLERLATDSLAFDAKDEADPKDPKSTRKVVYVKDGDAEAVSLDKYIDEHWSDFKSALRPVAAARGTPAPDAALRPPPVPGEGGLTDPAYASRQQTGLYGPA
jgi:hypothetical protein